MSSYARLEERHPARGARGDVALDRRPSYFVRPNSAFIASRLSGSAAPPSLRVVKSLFVWLLCACLPAIVLLAQVVADAPPAEVPFPDGYRKWMHISSATMPPKKPATDAPTQMGGDRPAAPHGVIRNIYANDIALEGYRTGHFPEGSVLVADWFVLEEKGGSLVQGPRQSLDVMIRDTRYGETGGWGFETFDQDSRTTRKVGANAVKMCFECHTRVKDRDFVFSLLRP